jgi:hypothetical protein
MGRERYRSVAVRFIELLCESLKLSLGGQFSAQGPANRKGAAPPKLVPEAVWLADLPSVHWLSEIHPACASHRADAPKHKGYRIFGPDFHLAVPPTAAKAESVFPAVHLGGLPWSSLHAGSETPAPPRRVGRHGYPQNAMFATSLSSCSRGIRAERERLRTLPDLDASALRLREMCLIVLDPVYADAQLRAQYRVW